MASSWSQLPSDILDLIFQRLSLPDCFTFHKVCQSWRSVFLERRRLTRPPPCMAISRIGSTKVYSLHGGQILSLISPKLKLSPGERTVGSSVGWLAIVRGCYLSHLLNPITDERILLPSFNSRSIHHVALSTSPISRNCILVVSASDAHDNLICAWCRLKDSNWTFLKGWPFWPCVSDMMFYQGKLCVVMGSRNITGEVYARFFHIYTFDPLPRAPLRVSLANISKNNHWFKQRFVQSGKELLLVGWRHQIENDKVVMLDVFKQTDEQGEWLRVENLGDRALVTNKNHFNNMESFCTQDFMGSGFEANCIYFSDLEKKELVRFSMADGSSQRIQIPISPEHNYFAKAEWIVAQAW